MPPTPACVYNALRHIDDCTSTPPHLDKLGAVLVEHGATSLVITRLHKHFELADGERVVLRLHHAAQKLVATVEAEAVSPDAVACSWQVRADGGLEPVAFIDGSPSLREESAAFVGANGATLRGAVTSVLNACKIGALCGLSLDLSRALGVPAGAVLLEATYDGRVQESSVVSAGSCSGEQHIVTHWAAKEMGGGIATLGKCADQMLPVGLERPTQEVTPPPSLPSQNRCYCDRSANSGHRHLKK